MTSIFFALVLSAFVGYVLWVLSESLEKKRGQIQQESLQAQIQLANNRANQLHTDLVRVQTELLQSTRLLESEREVKETALQSSKNPWKRFRVSFLLGALGIGICTGVYMGSTQTEKVYLKKIIQLEVARSVAESRFKDLQTSVDHLASELYSVREMMQSEKEARIISETKLELLLEKNPQSDWLNHWYLPFKFGSKNGDFTAEALNQNSWMGAQHKKSE